MPTEERLGELIEKVRDYGPQDDLGPLRQTFEFSREQQTAETPMCRGRFRHNVRRRPLDGKLTANAFRWAAPG